MKLTSMLTAVRLFGALERAGAVTDASSVNRVVIDARRGRPVAIWVETVADVGLERVIRETPLLDGLTLDPEDGDDGQ